MSWGWKIALLYIGFVVMMLALVFGTTTTRFHLVTEDYYQREKVVDDHFIRVKNAEQLATPVVISYLSEAEEISLVFPAHMKTVKGTILCYRPSNSDLDQTIELKVDSQNEVRLDGSKLQHGVWRIQVNWEGDTTSFFSEQVLVIP
ncbi:MAG: FixH family protein [Bacteroidota bacterium]